MKVGGCFAAWKDIIKFREFAMKCDKIFWILIMNYGSRRSFVLGNLKSLFFLMSELFKLYEENSKRYFNKISEYFRISKISKYS